MPPPPNAVTHPPAMDHRRLLRFPPDTGFTRQLYERAWSAYRMAGCPFGIGDTPMYIWFLFNQATRSN